MLVYIKKTMLFPHGFKLNMIIDGYKFSTWYIGYRCSKSTAYRKGFRTTKEIETFKHTPVGDTFIDRLKTEFDEVSERHSKLFYFLNTDDFKTLDYEHRQLLIKQEIAMREYRILLVQRLRLLNKT